MITEELVDLLVQEVDDLLGAGPVGLYEFVDILRGHAELSEADMQSVAVNALNRLLTAESVKLQWTLWSDAGYAEDAVGVRPCAADWQPPTDRPYLVVVSA